MTPDFRKRHVFVDAVRSTPERWTYADCVADLRVGIRHRRCTPRCYCHRFETTRVRRARMRTEYRRRR